jgi:YVTN family beta-propeller protein
MISRDFAVPGLPPAWGVLAGTWKASPGFSIFVSMPWMGSSKPPSSTKADSTPGCVCRPTKDGKTGFVALGPANRIAVVDGISHRVTKYLLVGQRVWHMAFTPDEKFLLSTNGVSNDVSVIDVASLRVIKTIQVGDLPWGVTISRD